MRRYRRQSLTRHIAILLLIPLALMSVGYALYSQNLSVNTSTIKPAYSSSQGLIVTYNRTVTPVSSVYTHAFNPVTITNNGPYAVSAWQFVFTLPSGFTNLSCTSGTCSTSGTTITMVNTGTNGTINPGGSVTVSFSFRSALTRYTLQNVNISGTVVPTYQTMSGLTISFTRTTLSKQGQYFRWTYNFTVTNNSGQNIQAWRMIGTPFNTTTTRVGVMDATVAYTTTGNQLTINRSATLNNGSTFTFSGRLESTDTNWVLTSYPIQGMPL